jgi:hypothetical protein
MTSPLPVRAEVFDMTTTPSDCVRILAPEDVRVGDVIVEMTRTVDASANLDLYDLICLAESQATPPTRRQVLPEQPEPLRVEGCSVPIVMTRTALGEPRLLDLRQCTVGRLDAAFGDAALRSLAEAAERAKAEAAAGSGSHEDGTEGIARRGRFWRRWRRGR